jgi:tryptophanase
MFGKINTKSGKETPALMELVRLALPRRTHTQSHIDYVIEVAREVYAKRNSLSGFKIIEQPKFLRHFSAKFEPLTRF